MYCWGGCQKMRNWPDEFPLSIYAICWWCHSFEQRARAPEWQVPKRLRWWRSVPKREWQ